MASGGSDGLCQALLRLTDLRIDPPVDEFSNAIDY